MLEKAKAASLEIFLFSSKLVDVEFINFVCKEIYSEAA
jgi:hypothetical protein